MYVTTFYSFKGGVGRSMALANVAVGLANLGRRVLVVDFDLEAPGLDTFDILRPREDVPGLIDFVHEYLRANRAPDARGFMSKLSSSDELAGELWIMPSGAQQATYAAYFSEIDWTELYEKRDGYLLFEDLKAQWKKIVDPDYVLVDSRTGHTNTGGICTRQLPDAVAVLFFPNEQNLRGLTKIVRDIKAEARTPRKKEIDLHFVMSNVPDLDDENRILARKIDGFKKKLGFEGDLTIVHRYDSLSLLNQAVFTKERPRSRLAKEYGRLVREIIGRNLADRDGALEYIERVGSGWRRRRMRLEPTEKNLEHIEDLHSGDGKVLFALGAYWQDDGQRDRALSLFDRAIEAGYDDPEVYLKRARIRASQNQAGAREDAIRVLGSDKLPPPRVREAVRLVVPSGGEDVATSRAVASLDVSDRIWLANGFRESLEEMGIAVSILEPLVGEGSLDNETRSMARSVLALHYIGVGRCGEAAALLSEGGRKVDDMDIQDAFNYGMAVWGETDRVIAKAFKRAVELDQLSGEREDENYLQCMAVARWAVGDENGAVDFVRRARVGGARRRSVFSSWRYREVVWNTFIEDLDEIEALINGDASKKPRFMMAAAADSTE